MRVWRVVPTGHQALEGEGTRRFGSRWVAKGLPAVYTSATLSLAALELFVLTDPDLAPADLLAISADVPAGLIVRELALSDLPGTWREIPAPARLQELGRSWIVDGKTALLFVPSVIVPTERNYVLNPEDQSSVVEAYWSVVEPTYCCIALASASMLQPTSVPSVAARR